MATMPPPDGSGDKTVRRFRQILLWPLQLMPLRAGSQIQRHWEVLDGAADSPWRELADEFTGVAGQFQERHYNEFVTFLPYVQRFLYGEGRTERTPGAGDAGASPMRVYRRSDVASVRLVAAEGAPPLELSIAHVDLHFFFDIDVVLLNVEVFADDVPLGLAQEALYRFGRAYPPGWDEHGRGLRCMHRVEWLGPDGTVLARSDAGEREGFLSFVDRHRAPRIGADWAFLLRPLVLDHADEGGAIRYRQIEYYRMPTMAYLAMDDPRRLSREDFVRLGLVTAHGGEAGSLPYAASHLADFESRFCYDRFWCEAGAAPRTRYLCCGHALVVVGDARAPFFVDAERGVLAQFRHQHFLLFLIAHFQKAALLMFSDRLVDALKQLDIQDASSVRRFKRAIRQRFEIFLRFTHRYWFHEISEQAQARALFRLCTGHLELDPLYAEVKQRISDMNTYLDTDSLRRQANTVVRLTVVTTFGLIGTVTTGFLGMNLIAAADSSPTMKLLYFLAVLVPTAALTAFTIVKSKRLSDVLDALSDERLSLRGKLAALRDAWRANV
jgi:hypothetical protein